VPWGRSMLKPYNRAQVTFDFLREIGADGRNSNTYLSYDHQLNAQIVIKRIEKVKLNSDSEFFDESKALYASAHSNVVQVYYACEDRDYIYIAMPYYENGSIKDKIANKYMTVREIVAAGCQVLSAIHNIHSKGLIHFDIKPDNILLSNRGEALLSDFGLAKQIRYGVAHQDRIYGKMMPPEAINSDRFNNTFDIYQLGVTLYRMCNGNDAFYRQFAAFGAGAEFNRLAFRDALRRGQFPDRSLFAPHIPTKLRRIAKKCMEPVQTDRYQSAIEVANALADVEGNSLDWRLVENQGTRTWTKNESGTLVELAVSVAGQSVCTKSKNGGTPRRVVSACCDSFSDKNIKDFLGAN
jgi:serine/threonine protein kinase